MGSFPGSTAWGGTTRALPRPFFTMRWGNQGGQLVLGLRTKMATDSNVGGAGVGAAGGVAGACA
eukprot:4302063-Lingulodinium_polyedra.AAC.1